MLRRWDELPEFMRCDEIREYYVILSRKQVSLVIKRIFDLLIALLLLCILAIPMIIISVAIKVDSKGPVLYRQERITTYGKVFRIHKFRTMVVNADKIGTTVTSYGDKRITKMGNFLRKYRMDEFPQIFDVIVGNMSFVGTRPEAKKYVKYYSKEMFATLLLPAGITSEASIKYKDEAELLNAAIDIDETYIKYVLPEKMRYNLDSLRHFSIMKELKTMLVTVLAILK